MNSPFCLVYNPAAGNGRAVRRMPAIAAALTRAGAEFQLRESTSLSHAKALAAEAAGNGDTVVAVGGDGLTGALAGPVAAAGGVLGLIPTGRGNDFARMLGIPASPADAARHLVEGHPRRVDLIGVGLAGGAETVVAGSVYLGVPSEGGEIANASRLTRGLAGYDIAGVRALLAWRPATFRVEVDGRAAAGMPGLDGGAADLPGFCVIVANSRYLAAGKKVAPDADITDGLLDVIMVGHGHKLTFVRAMLKASRGTHVQLSKVTTDRGASVSVSADRDMPAAADGETLPCAAPLAAGTALHIRALPGALRVIAPD
jgi:diacylglycerol kinase (ATP)